MSKYMVLLYANEAGMPKPGSPEFDTQNAAYGAVFEDFSKRGAFVAGDPLGPSASATSVRVRNGQSSNTPGPASNSAELDESPLAMATVSIGRAFWPP